MHSGTPRNSLILGLFVVLSGLVPVRLLAQTPCQQYVFDTSGGIPSASYSTAGGTNGPGSLSNQNGWIPDPAANPTNAMIAVSNAQSLSGTQSILVTGNGSDLRQVTRTLPVGCVTSNPPPDTNAGLISVRLRYKKGTVVSGAGVIVKPQVLDDAVSAAVFGFFQISGAGTMFGRGGVATTTTTDTFDPATYSGNGYPINGWHELEMRLNPNHTSGCDCVTDPATNTQIPFGNLLYIVNGNKVPAVVPGHQNPMPYYGGTNTSGKVGRLTFRREVGSDATTASAYFDSWEVWAHPRPVARSAPITVTLNAAGSYTLSAADLNNLTTGSVGGDQTQAITGRSSNPNTFSCASANGTGVNTVTLTLTQNDLQTSTVTSTVTVLRPGPTVTCQAGTLSRALSGGTASFTVSDIKSTSSAGSTCSTITAEQIKKSTALDATYGSSVSFDCTEIGGRAVTLRVTQNDGQVQTCTRNVTITEPAPTVACKNISVAFSGSPVTVNAADVNNGSAAGGGCSLTAVAIAQGDQTGTCSSATFGPSVSYGCTELGLHTVTLRVTQTDGQTACCTATVNVTGDDPDGDGRDASCDNCPTVSNIDQINSDGDALGDACDGCPSDANKTSPGVCGCGIPEGTCRTITQWRSVRAHTTDGDLPIVLNAAASGNGSTGPTIETRSGGIRQIEIDFDGPITLADPAGVVITGRVTTNGILGPSNGYLASSIIANGPNGLKIEFNDGDLPSDEASINISVDPGTIGEPLLGDNDCNIRVLEGDVTGDGVVNLSDVAFSKTKASAPEAAAACPGFDLDMSGGDIDMGDMQQTKAGVSSPTKMALCP